MRRNIIIFGGSFCPFHIGHLIVGAYVAQFVEGVDELWYMLSAQNPLKPPYPLADDERLALLRRAVEPYPFLKVSDIELSLPRPSYTIDTLHHLRQAYPGDSFKLLVGSDTIADLPRWRSADTILNEYGILVYPRPGHPISQTELPHGATLLPATPQIEISSTFIRKGIAAGHDMRPFLPYPITAGG